MSRTLLAPLMLLATGCFFHPSARPIAYTPHPEGVVDPVAELRSVLAASTRCPTSVIAIEAGDVIEVHHVCRSGLRDKPVDDVQRIPVKLVTAILPGRGDWAYLEVHVGEKEVFHWDFGSDMEHDKDAIRAADAFAALMQRGVNPHGAAPPIVP